MQKLWLDLDAQHCWHPFTQAKTSETLLLIESAQGCYIYDALGNAYLDAISSWWVNTHGHNHIHITQAICKQAQCMSHVIFSGVTHKPAIQLAQALVKKMPHSKLQHVFFTDNGSTAIEAALKMAIQYTFNQTNQTKQHTHLENSPHKKIFLAFDGAYHGDTFGAMALGKSSGFYTPFHDWLFEVKFIDFACVCLDSNIEELIAIEQLYIDNLKIYLEHNYKNIAAFIFEPLIQGASGMRMCRIEFLEQIIALCKNYHIICIADEVMTGFGRTGKLFACDWLKKEYTPDIICLSKGITGGALALGAVVASQQIYQAFYADDIMQAFLHGHSYTANPIACCAAIANLDIFEHQKYTQLNTFEHIAALSIYYQQELHSLQHKIQNHFKLNNAAISIAIKNIRNMGSIAAFDIDIINNTAILNQNIKPQATFTNYGSHIGHMLRLAMLKKGILIRPLGQTIYILPPYCITQTEIHSIFNALYDTLIHLSKHSLNSVIASDLF
jgi:adenosylmethionine---8-amino-7-oxononanoate aminotransferase